MTTLHERFSPDHDVAYCYQLDVLRITDEPCIITVFSAECVEIGVHYVDLTDYRGYVQCNDMHEDECLLCATHKARDDRLLMPVYDVESDRIAVMLISSTTSPHSLGPQLSEIMRQHDVSTQYIMISRRGAKYILDVVPIPAGGETGDKAIAEFIEHYNDDRVSLARSVPRLANSKLWDIPEIRRKAEALRVVDGSQHS